MTAYRKDLPALPPRMAHLPIDERGYPVPFFVAWIDGKPDHRIADAGKRALCAHRNLCWLCGQPLGRYLTFAIGPMCVVNRVTSEPPQHAECAEYAVTACPFLTRPHARRRDANLPEGNVPPGGIMIERNPGVTALWRTRSYQRFHAEGGALLRLGDPVTVAWYCEGRAATAAEVLEAVNTGLPLLRGMAAKEGPHAVAELETMIEQATALLPPL